MTIRTIGRFERHIEKLVLGGAVVVAAVLVARALVGEPNAVRGLGGAEITPGRVDALLDVEAERILARLEGPAEIDVPSPWPALPAFEAALEGGVVPRPSLQLPVSAVALRLEAAASVAVAFGVPEIPAPAGVAAGPIADTLADGVVQAHPALAALVPAAPEPPDLAVVVAAGTIDLAQLRRSVESCGLPAHWQGGRADRIVDVVLLRQELVGGAWAAEQEVGPIPGQLTLRGEIAGRPDASAREGILDRLDDPGFQLAIVQPDFYATRHGTLDDPLREISGGAAGSAPGDPGPGDLGRLVRERDRLVRWLADHCGVTWTGGADDGESDDGADRGTGSGGGGDPFRPGGEPGKRPKADRPEAPRCPPETIRRITRDIERLDRRIAELTAALPAAAVAAAEPPGTSSDELAIWAYDLGGRAGHTYRYAFRVRACNPFFGRERALAAEQRHLAAPFTLDSPVSPWSDPVEVPALTRVWITRADAGPGLGRLTAEIHRYYDGRVWMERFAAGPGDAIGGRRAVADPEAPDGPARPVDFTSGLSVVDIVGARDEGAGGHGPGPGAVVLVAEAGSSGRLELRDPAAERVDPARDRPWRIRGWPDFLSAP